MLQLLKRTAWAVTLLLGVVVASFIMFNVVPGDAARVILGPNASEDAVKQLRTQLGTDRPLLQQWVAHLKGLARFDLGQSTIDGRSVSDEVIGKFLVTAKVGALGAIIALLSSYLMNLIVYLYPRTRVLIRLASLGVVTPTFFTGVMAALLVGVWFPIVRLTGYGTGDGNWTVLLLPAFIAALYPTALMTQLLREKLSNASEADYARAARAFGFSKMQVFHRALLSASVVSWLAAWINQISIIFVASFILEVIFTIPGVGSLLIGTIQRKDYPMLQGILLVNALFFVTLSWLGDAVFGWLDPRTRQHVAS